MYFSHMKIWVMNDTSVFNIRWAACQNSSIEIRRAKKTLLLLGQFKSFYFCDCTFSNLIFSQVLEAEMLGQPPDPKGRPRCIHQSCLHNVNVQWPLESDQWVSEPIINQAVRCIFFSFYMYLIHPYLFSLPFRGL